MASPNLNRKKEQIKIMLSQILGKSSGNPKFEGVTIIEVKLSPDSAQALVFFAVYSPSYPIEEITKDLNKAHGFFQSKLGKNFKSRNVPRLQFVYDKGFDHTQRIDEILQKIQ